MMRNTWRQRDRDREGGRQRGAETEADSDSETGETEANTEKEFFNLQNLAKLWDVSIEMLLCTRRQDLRFSITREVTRQLVQVMIQLAGVETEGQQIHIIERRKLKASPVSLHDTLLTTSDFLST
eukprot:271815-Hanusia_phi.AAC.1